MARCLQTSENRFSLSLLKPSLQPSNNGTKNRATRIFAFYIKSGFPNNSITDYGQEVVFYLRRITFRPLFATRAARTKRFLLRRLSMITLVRKLTTLLKSSGSSFSPNFAALKAFFVIPASSAFSRLTALPPSVGLCQGEFSLFKNQYGVPGFFVAKKLGPR